MGKKVHPNFLRKCFCEVLENVGIEDFWWHHLRHTFATRMAQAGVDLFKISKLLGHKDIRMTQHYAHHYPDGLRDGVEILETDCNMTSVGKQECSKSF